MRICEGWSEPLLVAHTTLLEISCYGSFGSCNYYQMHVNCSQLQMNIILLQETYGRGGDKEANTYQ